MDPDVVSVAVIGSLSLLVTFSDGTAGTVQLEKSYLTGVFAALADPAVFAQAFVDDGAVAWPGGIDLAPDAMYLDIKANGTWVLE